MDLNALLALIPTQYISYITAAVTFCALLCTVLPAPAVKHGIYYYFYQAVNTIAANVGHAKSLSAPESTGIVGGASAISAPLIATDVVPLITATPQQKVVTTMPDVTAVAPAEAPPAAIVAGQQAAAAFAAKKALTPGPTP